MNTSKIIRAVVGGGRYTKTAPLMKEDHGIYLKIEGIDLPATYEIDFSNERENGSSVTMIGNADGVLIPQQFIKSGKDIYAFYYHVGENYGKTTYIFHIPNRLRPDRTDEEPTPEEQSVIDQTIAALNDAVESTAADAEQTASDAARAEAARTAAESAETNASASAAAAAQSEANAAQSESTASAAATSASASAASAREDAQSASQNADRAEQAAAQSGYMFFYIDENGDLHYQRTDNVDVDFYLNDGDLYVRAGA